MKKMLAISLFTLATLAWAGAQQPGAPSAQAPGASQSPSSMPGQQPGQRDVQSGSQGPVISAPVVEGCLGGSSPNYTITDASGVTYKLNIPPTADTSKLAAHVGEPVAVAGNVNNAGAASIDVRGIGRGTTNCPAKGATGGQAQPKQ